MANHVHGLGTDPQTGDVYVATHTGLFRIVAPDPGAAPVTSLGEPLASLRQDTMGFTMVEGAMFGSGHPDPSLALPPNLGFITSTDGGFTWQNVSTSHAYDFHDLAVVDDGLVTTIYGYNAQDGRVNASHDGGKTWMPQAKVELRDLTADTIGTVYATTAAGLAQSDDGGATFTIAETPAAFYLVQAVPGSTALVGITSDNAVWLKAAGASWQRTGEVPREAEAMLYTVDPTDAMVIADAEQVAISYNLGATWTTLVRLS